MNYIKTALIFLCLAVIIQGCGKSMTIVKTHPKSAAQNAYVSGGRWQDAYNKGLTHLNKKQYDKALEFFTLALKDAGDNDETRAWMYFSIGRCWEGLKDLAKAQQNYIMAQNLDPNLTEASNSLARISKRLAEKE
jgi:tetratricopeptide (TPR) repeat protein